MSEWRPEHADQVRRAHEVLRRASGDATAAEVLYRDWYAARPPHVVPRDRWSAPVPGTARASHAAAMHWPADELDVVANGIAGVVVVATPRGRRALCRGEYVTVRGRAGFPPRVGDRVRAVERLGAVVQEGWWRTWGSGWNPRAVPRQLVRLYLRPAAGAEGGLVHALTTVLTSADEWLLKVAASPEHLSRPDACVAYLAGPSRDRLRLVVAEAAAGLTMGEPPPLTERLGDGIGWAEDPGTGESFGEVRCAAVATAYGRRGGHDAGAEEWLDLVACEFRRRGLDPGAPHRGVATLEVA